MLKIQMTVSSLMSGKKVESRAADFFLGKVINMLCSVLFGKEGLM